MEEGMKDRKEGKKKKTEKKKRNTLFEWIALQSYAWKDNLEAEKNRVSFSRE